MSNRVICPKCGHSNSRHRVTCKRCRVNLAQARAEESRKVVLPQEAAEHLERARKLFNNLDETAEQDKERLYRDIAAECALAISKADGPFPEPHAMLGWVYLFLEQPDKAFKEFSRASQEDPDNFWAVAGRVRVLGMRYYNATQSVSTGDWGTLLFGLGKAQDKASSFVAELNRLIRVFRRALSRSQDVEEWIWMSEQMLELSDVVDRVPTMLSRKPSLCAPVAEAPWDTLDITGHEDEVREIRQKAKGRALLDRM